MRRLAVLIAATAAALPLAVAVAPAASHADTTIPLWLQTVNQYRAEAGVPPVTEDPALSAADLVHVKYLAAVGFLTHPEDPSNPLYTDVGNQAGTHSDLAEGGFVNEAAAVDDWMHAPFHALGVLRPTITQMGYAQFKDSHGMVWAALDVLSDNNGTPSVTWPVTWPNANSGTRLLAYNGESPDLLTSCPGYSTPTSDVSGLPLIVSLGPNAASPQLVTATLTSNGVELPSCVVTENNFSNPSGQDVGRAILGENHTILVVPQLPLEPNTTYTLLVTADGTPVVDTFTTGRGANTVDIQWLSPSAYDGQSTFFGGYLNSDFGNLGGKLVKVLAGSTVVGSTTTKPDGSWVVAVPARGGVAFTSSFAGDAGWLPSSSTPLTIKSLANPVSLALVPAATTVHKGSRVKLTAPLINTSNNARVRGVTVYLWAKPYGSTWRRVTSVRTNSFGQAIFYPYMAKTTSFQVRFLGTTTYPRYRAVNSRTVTARAV